MMPVLTRSGDIGNFILLWHKEEKSGPKPNIDGKTITQSLVARPDSAFLVNQHLFSI
jgi:hypothetical protein